MDAHEVMLKGFKSKLAIAMLSEFQRDITATATLR